ncbi:hypothetical protein KDL67_08375 [bacterium]|nr:hypothetical protein [bacterium]
MRTLSRAVGWSCLLLALSSPVLAADAPPDSSVLRGWLSLFSLLTNPLGADAVSVEPGWRVSADLRVRQEMLSDVFYFTPTQPDRNWLRVRSRAGLRYGWGNAHEIQGRLCSEFRKITTPDTELNFDEIIVDQLLYRYRAWPGIAITLGRQDIRWNDGFLVMDGTPLDGSRSSYMNALRFMIDDEGPTPGLVELFVAYNPAYDDLVLWNDDVKRRLTDADETAVAFRSSPWANQQLALIWKRERDPDHLRPALDAWTLGYRGERTRGAVTVTGELALQYQDWSGHDMDDRGYAWAFQFRARRAIGATQSVDFGAFGYSPRQGNQLAFRTPWGRWPKWSELMLYQLIGQDGVGQWANLGGVWIEGQQRVEGTVLGLGFQGLTALGEYSGFQDVLVRLRLELPLPAGLQMQVLAESLVGLGHGYVQHFVYPASDVGYLIDSSPSSFFRWQLTYARP